MGELSDRDACLLWGRAGGRCSNPGCRKVLFEFTAPKLVGNAGERAHIVGKKETAARGDPDRSTKLAAELSNHILLCTGCHKMVDDAPDAFSEELLREWKEEHEARVAELLDAGLGADSTVVVRLNARFGAGDGRILVATDYQMLKATLALRRVFDPRHELKIVDADITRRDSDADYWKDAEHALSERFQRLLKVDGQFATLPHLSVFASGPIPVLMALGKLIGDTRPVDVYDYHRDTNEWAWPMNTELLDFQVSPDADQAGTEAALVLDLSGKTDKDAIRQALNSSDIPMVIVTVSNPRTGLIRSPAHLAELRRAYRQAFEKVKRIVGDQGTVHVFPAVPLSAAVAFGQSLLPKAMPAMRVYDNNAGWKQALTLLPR